MKGISIAYAFLIEETKIAYLPTYIPLFVGTTENLQHTPFCWLKSNVLKASITIIKSKGGMDHPALIP